MNQPSRAARALATVTVAALALALAPAAPAAAEVPVAVLAGTGWGHGVGLSQWGAEYLARSGRSAQEIVSTFYPGAQLAEATGPVRVAVHRPAVATTTLTFPQGGEVRSALEGPQAPGFPVTVGPGGRVRVSFDGSAYRAEPLVQGQSWAATPYQECLLIILCLGPGEPPPEGEEPPAPPADGGGGEPGPQPGGEPPAPEAPPAPQPNGAPPAPPPGPGPAAVAASGAPLWAVPAGEGVTTVDERGRAYRGVVQATADAGFRLVNHVDVEHYLRGMAEVPGTWPAAAVQAQTIAARTYALRAMQGGGEMCDDARCQVYAGAGAESPGQDAAVAATARQVVVHGGALAAAVYSADAGGVSATTEEGFGTPDGVYPYLTTVRYPTDNPLPWQRSVALADVASRLGYPGTVTDVRITRAGPSERALEVVLDGTAGPSSVDGRRFARALGLRSTRFTVEVSAADAAPAAPPPAEEVIQELPDDATSVAAGPRRPTNVRFERAARAHARVVAADVPPALDPRRHPATVAAIVLAALGAGALVPLGLAGWPAGARPFSRWRLLPRRS